MSARLERAGIAIDGRWLVRGASLALDAGRLTAIIGPNGAGKTTLLKLLAGVWTPGAGKATLHGRDLRALPRRELGRHIAWVAQEPRLAFDFSVREAVSMGRYPHRGRFERERACDRRAVQQAMERTDIAHLGERLVTELSDGERRRVAIARGLATEAETILLDEPTANLDLAHALAVLDLCRRLTGAGKTVALAIHDLNAAARYADHVVLVHSGTIIAQGAPADVLTEATLRAVFGVRTERLSDGAGETVLQFHSA